MRQRKYLNTKITQEPTLITIFSLKIPYFDALILYSCQKALQRKCACKQIIHD